MSLLKPKYIPAWKILQSPFDKRAPSEVDATAPISYGLNGNNKPLGGTSGTSIAGLAGEKVTNPSAFILFAPAQAAGQTVSFSGTPAAAVAVYKDKTGSDAVTGGTTYQIKAPNLSNKCVDVSANSSANGANVQLWTCNGSSAQKIGGLARSREPRFDEARDLRRAKRIETDRDRPRPFGQALREPQTPSCGLSRGPASGSPHSRRRSAESALQSRDRSLPAASLRSCQSPRSWS